MGDDGASLGRSWCSGAFASWVVPPLSPLHASSGPTTFQHPLRSAFAGIKETSYVHSPRSAEQSYSGWATGPTADSIP